MGYAFVLGRNPDLSIAELGSLFEKLEIAKNRCVVFVEKLPAAPLQSAPLQSAPQDFLNRLGGCTEILEITNKNISIFEIEAALEKLLKAQCKTWHGKCKFSIDLLPERKSSKLQKMLLISMKKRIGSASFLNKDYKNVSYVAASAERLVERGTKVAIIEEGDGRVSIGVSLAIQDFAAYAKRDYGKPFRDPKAGMLPPKLAQIMLNLAVITSEAKLGYPVIASTFAPLSVNSAKQSSIIFDPFCGTGTILMEAMLMGYSVIGSDADKRMVEGTKKNIEWLQKNFKIAQNATSEIFEADAALSLRVPTYVETKQSIAIITESFLGSPLSSFPHERFLDQLIAELSALYLKFFQNLTKITSKNTPVVFIFPYWKSPNGRNVHLSERLVAKIEHLGYSKTTFVPLQTTSLFYDRPDQIVGREIVRFVKM